MVTVFLVELLENRHSRGKRRGIEKLLEMSFTGSKFQFKRRSECFSP